MTAALRGAVPGSLADAVACVAAQGLVAYPTETVWGLGADARSERALERLRAVKGRDAEQPVALLVTGLGAAAALGLRVDARATRLARAFWPGPLTLVLPASARFARGVARHDGAVGLRCSSHAAARELAEALERAGVGPVTATSLNRSGDPPARGVDEARRLAARARESIVVLEAPEAGGAPASTVVDLTGPEPSVVRAGAIDEADLRAALEHAP